MDNLIKSEHGSLDRYERGGVSMREVAKGVFTRFLPASLATLLGAVFGLSSGNHSPLPAESALRVNDRPWLVGQSPARRPFFLQAEMSIDPVAARAVGFHHVLHAATFDLRGWE